MKDAEEQRDEAYDYNHILQQKVDVLEAKLERLVGAKPRYQIDIDGDVCALEFPGVDQSDSGAASQLRRDEAESAYTADLDPHHGQRPPTPSQDPFPSEVFQHYRTSNLGGEDQDALTEVPEATEINKTSEMARLNLVGYSSD